MASESADEIDSVTMAEYTPNVGLGTTKADESADKIELPAKRLASSDRDPAKGSSPPKKRVVLRHLMSAGSASADDTGENAEDARDGSKNEHSPPCGRLRPIGIRLPAGRKLTQNLELMPSFAAAGQIFSVLSETVGLGVFVLNGDLEDQAAEDEAATEATKLAIRDALSRASLHLNVLGNCEHIFASIQLAVPDMVLERMPFLDLRPAIPKGMQVTSLNVGVGGMYVPARIAAGEHSAPPPSPRIVVVASVTTASPKAPATSRSVDEAVSKADLIRKLFDQENEIRALKSQLQTSCTGETSPGPSTSVTSPSISNPWTHPTVQTHPRTEKSPARAIATSNSTPTAAAGTKSPDSTIQEVVYEQGSFLKGSSRTDSNSISAAVSSGSSGESITSPSHNTNDFYSAKLDQLVDVMDQEEKKEVENNYHDYVSVSNDFLEDQKATFEHSQTDLMLLSKRAVSFPIKIMIMLEDVHLKKKTNIVAWMPHGRAFKVFDHDRFETEILPLYMDSAKYCSFLRQLNLYGFRRFCAGADKVSAQVLV